MTLVSSTFGQTVVPSSSNSFCWGLGSFFFAEPGAQYEAEIWKSEQKNKTADVKQEGLNIENLTAHPLD
jgi:hypothetical protein